MMGDGPLSELIAWASDGSYSHAGIVVDGETLVEASLGGVRRYPLARRLAELDHFHVIDAWRPHDGAGQTFAPADRALVRGHAEGMLGTPYPVDQLALLGVVMAVRGKWPAQPLLRRLVRIALDHALPSTSPAMVCSEVVYRALAECGAEPRGRLAPAIVEGERGTAPFPAIDWQRLYDEFAPLLFPRGAGARLRAPGDAGVDASGDTDGGPTDQDLEQARLRVLSGLGPQDARRAAKGADAGRGYLPNPRLVSPQDLANSPATRLLGRLLQRG